MGIYPCCLFQDENQIQVLSPCYIKFQAVGSLPRAVVGSPCQEGLKIHVDVALGDMG